MTYGSSLKTVIEAAANTLAPPGRGSLTAWASEHFRLSSEASATTGQFRPLPFQVEPLECMASHSEYEQTCLMWASQLSKTTLTLAFLAHTIVEDPGPCLVVQPNLQMSEVWSKQRLAPMLRDMPVMKGIVADSKSRDSGSTVFSRAFRGGHVSVASAGSPAGLASRPIRYLILDEVDRFEASAGSEGSPSSLAIARTRTYRASRKILWTSSPTIAGASEIETIFAQSDQREYEIPCPLCEHYQVLTWRRVEWPEHDPENAFYRCEGCEGVICHHQKAEMVSKGRWIARNPDAKIAGFRLSELVSPFRSWGEMAIDFLAAQGNPEKLRAFINTSLSELWNDEAQGNVDRNILLGRVENWGSELPAGVAVLVAGVDVQANRLELELVGYGKGEESWSIEYRVFPGDPTAAAVWKQLDDYLLLKFPHANDIELPIVACCVDSGASTQSVYEFCRTRFGRKIFAIKGKAGGYPVWPRKATQNTIGRTPLWMIGVDSAKATVYGRLKISEAGPGYCHFPVERTGDWFDQLLSEVLVTTYRRGKPNREWRRKPGARAEVLDCRCYSYAALQALVSMGMRLDAEADRIAALSGPVVPMPPPKRVFHSQWMNG